MSKLLLILLESYYQMVCFLAFRFLNLSNFSEYSVLSYEIPKNPSSKNFKFPIFKLQDLTNLNQFHGISSSIRMFGLVIFRCPPIITKKIFSLYKISKDFFQHKHGHSYQKKYVFNSS